MIDRFVERVLLPRLVTCPREVVGCLLVIFGGQPVMGKERQQILLDAQTEAEKIIAVAKERVEYLVSDKGVTSEARVRGEDVLRRSREDAKASMSEIEHFALRIFEDAERAMRDGIDKLVEAKGQLNRSR